MTNSTPAGITVSYDDSGGTPVDITAHCKEINEFTVEQILENARAYGSAWEAFKAIGIGKVGLIELKGDYDDTSSTGPNALFAGRIPESPATASRTLTFAWGTGETSSVETRLVKYVRTPMREGLTKWGVTLQPTGAVTEA